MRKTVKLCDTQWNREESSVVCDALMALIFGLEMTEFDLMNQFIHKRKIRWFSVWDWQESHLVGCLMNL